MSELSLKVTRASENENEKKRKFKHHIYDVNTLSSMFLNQPSNIPARHRGGKWTPEEEVYAEYLTSLFMQGVLPDCDVHVTLRAYLAEKLNCKPMRVTKKYTSSSYDGKMMYTPSGVVIPDMSKLDKIREKFVQSLDCPRIKRSHKKKEPPTVWDEQAGEVGNMTSGTSSGDQSCDAGDLISDGPVEYFQIGHNPVCGQLTPEGMEILRDAMLR